MPGGQGRGVRQPQSLRGKPSLKHQQLGSTNLGVRVTFVLRQHQHHQTRWVKVSKSYLEQSQSHTDRLCPSGTDKLYVGQTYVDCA